MAVAAASPAVSRRPAAWILDPRRDLLLFVATPVLLIPLVWLAGRVWPPETLYVVATFGALGHHLPGMMRAYGDRDLFARFRTRFIVAPIFLVGIVLASAAVDPSMSAIVLVTYLWGVWHGLMQTHGFLRIYDAKVGSVGRLTARLDHAMCLTWFVLGVLLSQTAIHHILQELAMAGGPVPAAGAVHTLRLAWGGLTGLVTLAWALHTAHAWRSGHRPSPVKILLLATSISFWLYANVVVGNLLVGILLFEMFHDVQYLSIVWLYNRRRVDGGSRVDTFTRFVFRNRAYLLLLYVGCVFAYGALRLVPTLPSALAQQIFTAVLAASALLHFYFDSFIWKVKEKTTRAGLGLAGGEAERAAPRAMNTWGLSGLRWSFLVVPLAWLAMSHVRSTVPAEAKMLQLGREFPNYSLAQHNMAIAHATEGRIHAAIDAERRALALETFDRGLRADASANLVTWLVEDAVGLLSQDRIDLASPLLHEASQLEPRLAESLRSQGVELARAGDTRGAALAARAAELAVRR